MQNKGVERMQIAPAGCVCPATEIVLFAITAIEMRGIEQFPHGYMLHLIRTYAKEQQNGKH